MQARSGWRVRPAKARPSLWNSRWSERSSMPEATVTRPTAAREETVSLGSVLIIDDEAAIRESLQTLLELEGYEVETANDGQEGLTRIAERPFDLVLIDFAMP